MSANRAADLLSERIPVEEGLVTVPQASSFLSVSRAKLYAMMGTGELPFVKMGRCRRVPRRALLALVERNLVGR
jgi:excisionase family DNA binding protein